MVRGYAPVLLECTTWGFHVAVACVETQGGVAFGDPVQQRVLSQKDVCLSGPPKCQDTHPEANEVVRAIRKCLAHTILP